MAIEDRIECQSCGRAVVPHLWIDDRDQLIHPRVIHLCPFCGTVLRQTGGQPNRRELAFILGFVGLGVLMLLLMLLKAV